MSMIYVSYVALYCFSFRLLCNRLNCKYNLNIIFLLHNIKPSSFTSKAMFYWNIPFLVGWAGWVFSCSIRKKLFSVGLVDQLFHQADANKVEIAFV